MSSTRTDLTPAFELCWRASDSGKEILDKAIPDDPDVHRSYFGYLLQTHPEDAPAVWQLLAPRLERRDVEMGARFADALLVRGQVEPAVQVWNHLCRHELMPCRPLDPARGPVLTSGRFRPAPSALAFDWRLPEMDGIDSQVENLDTEPGLSIRLNGAQPESADLLWQWAPVEPNRTYHLRFRYQTSGLPSDTGLYWSVWDATLPQGPPSILVRGLPLRASPDQWADSEATFRTAPKTRLMRLVFGYQRSLGTTRAEGVVSLLDVDVEPTSPLGASAPPRKLHP
jgi:hypothetical protein